MTASAQTPEAQLRLNHVAGQWYVRRQQPQWSAADQRALDAWLAEDAAHRAAFDGVGRSWSDAAQLKALFPQTYATATNTTQRPARRSGWLARLAGMLAGPPHGRAVGPAVAALVFVAVMTGGYGWYRWDHTPGFALDLATAPGEMRSADLPDGSRVVLNTGSTLAVRYYPRRRETVLERGEAFFEVARDAARPFTVDSGVSQVRVLGTAFNVRAAPPALVVQVREGRVAVRTDRHQPDAPALVLEAGAGVAIDPATGRHRPVAAAPEAVGEWRSGQIYFKRMPLAEVAQELARYLGEPVAVEGAGVGALPVSGLLALRQPERFLLALPSLVDVRVDRQDGGGWRIARR